MQFSTLVAALVLAIATPSFAMPAITGTSALVSQTTETVELDIHFSQTVLTKEYHVILSSTPHEMYSDALNLYHHVKRLMRHVLTYHYVNHHGLEPERLLEVALSIQKGESLLNRADMLNDSESKFLKRQWVKHEIKHLLRKFERARRHAFRLPNLSFACQDYNFVVDESKLIAVKVEEAGALTALEIKAAAESVHGLLHHIKTTIGWAVDEIEEEFIYIGHSIKDWAHDTKEKVEDWAHETKEKIHNRWELHKQHDAERWDKVKNFFHHKCETEDCVPCNKDADSCPANGVVLVAETEEVNVSIKWTRRQAEYEVIRTVREFQEDDVELVAELHESEAQVLAAKWE